MWVDVYYKTGILNVMIKITMVKKQNFIRSTKINSPTSDSGATSLPTNGHSYMYIEKSSGNHGKNVFFVVSNKLLLSKSPI